MTQITPEQTLQSALAHHQAGRLAEAERLYRQLLDQEPRHHGALRLLGVLTGQQGRMEAAIALIGRAIVLCPDVAEYHNDLGESYRRAARHAEAIACFGRAIALRPGMVMAHHNLGRALVESGRHGEAIAALREALRLLGSVALIEASLGLALHATGQRGEAIAAYRRALALEPNDQRVQSNLGVALQETGRIDEAIAAYRRALALGPGDARVEGNLGVALQEAGRFDEAIEAFLRALALEPADAEALYNLGNTLRQKGETGLAISALRRALAVNPRHAGAQNNLGAALHASGLADEAIAAYHQALALVPDHAEALNNLGNVYKDQGRLDDALAAFRKALAAKPDFARAGSNLVFTLLYHPDHDARSILAAHRQWAGRFAAPLAAECRPHPNDRAPGRKLRVGFLSPDLRGHPVGQSLLPLFLHRDRAQLEFIGYSDVKVGDELTTRLKSLADGWHETGRLDDRQLAEKIRAEGVDILVDPTLHTGGSRLLVFARKPAPVQLTMLGPPATTGLDTMDYRLTDPYLDPPGPGDADYTEESIRLPHCFWIFAPPEPAVPVGPLPLERNGFVTFGCLNQLAKVNPPVWTLWRAILQALPDARLIMQAPRGSHVEAIRAGFEEGGVARERITFLTRTTRRAYLARYQELDLALDPFPYNGHTSTFDALFMGVPVVTLAGRTAVGRGGVSILSNAGVAELITRTPEEYVALAVALAGDRKRLGALRAALRGRVLASPLVDGRQYAADVAAALRKMWKRWCES